MSELQGRIMEHAYETVAPGGGEILVLDLARAEQMAEEFQVHRRSVELAALHAGVVPLRYERNLGTMGIAGQIALLEAKVAVVGAGGLGGTVSEILARIGVGQLVLIDADRYEESNLNRQLHSVEDNVGQDKSRSSAARIRRINGAVSVTSHVCRLERDNAHRLLGTVDLTIDCLDSVPDRLVVAEICGSLGIPMVHGAVAGTMGQVMTVFPGDGGLEGLYEEASPHGAEVHLGNLATTVVVVASLQCQEAVKVITGAVEPIRHRLLLLDLAHGSFETVDLS